MIRQQKKQIEGYYYILTYILLRKSKPSLRLRAVSTSFKSIETEFGNLGNLNLPPETLRELNIGSGTNTSRNRQSSDVLGSGVGRLVVLPVVLVSLAITGSGTPARNRNAISSHA